MKPWENPDRTPPRATETDFAEAARQLGCSVAEIKAVWQVEAAGRPYRKDGSVERRFEPHHFPSKHHSAIGFSVRPGEAPWRASLRLSNEAMLNRAYGVAPEPMMRASSWGGPQIMGFNHQDAGFIAAKNMVEAMARSERDHLRAFTTLINNWGLAGAIRAHDWAEFARRYNGPGQVKHYAGMLERAFGVTSTQKHAAALEKATRATTGEASRVVLRRGSEGVAVAHLQRALNVKDDGVFGISTEHALKAFQTANGLKSDGVAGARTWAVLDTYAKTKAIPTQPTTAVDGGVVERGAAVATVFSGAAAVAAYGGNTGMIVAAVIVVIVVGALAVRARR